MSEPTAPQHPRSWVRTAVGVVLLVLVAIAGTTLILTLDHPSTETSLELTAREHALLVPRFAQIDEGIDRLVEEATALSTAGREVLTRARSLDPDGADAAVLAGSQASAAISGLREDLIKRREVLTADIDPERLRETDRMRIGTVDRALIAATQLPVSWSNVVAASSDPVDLVRSIQAHDARVVEATAAARADDLTGAVAALDDAQRLLVPAHAIRQTADQAGGDVSILDDLLARLDTYDDALERLYSLLIASGGSVTDEIRGVYAEVEAAQQSLPLNEDAVMVVVSDLAGPAVTAALVSLEDQRAVLADAVAARPDADGG